MVVVDGTPRLSGSGTMQRHDRRLRPSATLKQRQVRATTTQAQAHTSSRSNRLSAYIHIPSTHSLTHHHHLLTTRLPLLATLSQSSSPSRSSHRTERHAPLYSFSSRVPEPAPVVIDIKASLSLSSRPSRVRLSNDFHCNSPLSLRASSTPPSYTPDSSSAQPSPPAHA